MRNVAILLFVPTLFLSASPSFAQVHVTSDGPISTASYTTLKDAFAKINERQHTGVIRIDITGNTTETLTAVLFASGTGSPPSSYDEISIKPSGGAWTISGNLPGQPLIDLDGADRVTIDGLNPPGTPGNSLTISNVSAALGANTIRFRNDATDNIITRCTILGSSTSSNTNPGATIIFSTGTTTGNDRNTISMCNIGPADPLHPPTQAIRGSGSITNAEIRNSIVKIENNNIYDFFGTGKTNTSGIGVGDGNDDWTISNNRIYQRVSRTFTAAGRYAGIVVNTATPSGAFTITGNRIGFGEADGTGTTIITGTGPHGLENQFRGIEILSVSKVVVTTIQDNTISGIRQTAKHNDLNSPVFIGVNMSNFIFNDDPGGLIHAIDNTIGSLDGTLDGFLPSSIVIDSTSTRSDRKTIATVRGFSNFTEQSTTISGNKIGSITIQGPPAVAGMLGFDGIYVNPNFDTNGTITNNIIGGTLPNGVITNTQTGTYVMTGIRSQRAHASPISGNLIRNMTSHSNGPGLLLTGITCGGSAGSNTISQNTVHSLSVASATGGSAIFGMSLNFKQNRNAVTRNFVHSLSIKAATGSLVGIHGSFFQGNSKAIYANNMVNLGTDANGMPVSPGVAVSGIRERDSLLTNGTNDFIFNTVYVGGEGSGVANSYAFISEKLNTPGSSLRNNIFWNERSHTGPGKNYAIAIAGTGRLTSNFNDLRANLTPGVAGLTGLVINPPQDLPTLAAWRMFTGQDVNSIDLDPLLITPIGTAETVNLHVLPGTPVQAMATPSSITTDFDNDLRPTPPLRPDIGADEISCSTTSVIPNSDRITIPDPDLIPSDGSGNATPYPSIVTVAGLGLISTPTGSVQVKIHQFTHTAPDDVGVVLVGPTSAALLVQDGAGDNTGMDEVTYTLNDIGVMRLPDLGSWPEGTYNPTNYYFPLDIFPQVMGYGNPGPVPAGAPTYATFASVFGGTNPNGDWKLYVRDFARQDVGLITGGWTLILTTDLACPTPSALASAPPTSSPMPTPIPASTPATIPTTTAVPIRTPVATPVVAATPDPTAAATTRPTITPMATPAPAPAEIATPTLLPTTQTINLSARLRLQTGDNVGIAGFVIAGSAAKHVLVRAIGPSLAQSGISDSLADPVLSLHGPGAFRTINNDNWKDTLGATIQGTGMPPANDFESAIDATLAPGAYTAIVQSKDNTSGLILIEVYDLNQGIASKLANLSTRAFVGTGNDIVIAGFRLSDNVIEDRIVVRGIGPSLTAFGVPKALADPTLELRDGNGALLLANDDWQDNPAQAAELTAAGLAPTNQLESGVAATLPPGPYTALLRGLNNGTGVGLVEVYDLGP